MKNQITFLFLFIVCILPIESMSTPLIKLIISPCEYNNKEVYTSGLLGIPNALQPNDAKLFLTKNDFKFNNLEQSIIVNLPDEAALKKELYNNKFVGIMGTYDCSIGSHGNFGSGGFKIISRITLAHKNPNVGVNLFPGGLLKEIHNKRITNFGKLLLNKFKENTSEKKLYDFLFKRFKDGAIKIERLNWIFENYFSELRTENYNLCNVFEYEENDDTNKNTGFLCFSKSICDFTGISDAKELPDWRSKQNRMCLIYDDEDNELNLSLIQFN